LVAAAIRGEQPDALFPEKVAAMVCKGRFFMPLSLLLPGEDTDKECDMMRGRMPKDKRSEASYQPPSVEYSGEVSRSLFLLEKAIITAFPWQSREPFRLVSAALASRKDKFTLHAFTKVLGKVFKAWSDKVALWIKFREGTAVFPPLDDLVVGNNSLFHTELQDAKSERLQKVVEEARSLVEDFGKQFLALERTVQEVRDGSQRAAAKPGFDLRAPDTTHRSNKKARLVGQDPKVYFDASSLGVADIQELPSDDMSDVMPKAEKIAPDVRSKWNKDTAKLGSGKFCFMWAVAKSGCTRKACQFEHTLPPGMDVSAWITQHAA
jgi:hypothetical protein